MAQESNILITPFRAAFPEAGNVADFSVVHPDFPQNPENLWVWFDPDKVSIRYGRGTRKTMTVYLVEGSGLYLKYPCASEEPFEAHAPDWLALADQLDTVPIYSELLRASMVLMRQIGGDPAYAGAYVLKGDDDE